MILLALIPAASLLIIIVLSLRAKHAYHSACSRVSKQAETMRQEKISLDDRNDADLIAKVVAGEKPQTQLLAEYDEKRKDILPEAARPDLANWTNEDLASFLRRWAFALNAGNQRKILFSFAFTFIGLIAVAGAFAAWRYSAISYQPNSKPDISQPVGGSDPFKSFSSTSSKP